MKDRSVSERVKESSKFNKSVGLPRKNRERIESVVIKVGKNAARHFRRVEFAKIRGPFVKLVDSDRGFGVYRAFPVRVKSRNARSVSGRNTAGNILEE